MSSLPENMPIAISNSKRKSYCGLLYIIFGVITLQIPSTFAEYSKEEPPLTAHSQYGNIVITHGGLAWTSDTVIGKNVLVIHSYHQGDKKTNELMRGIYDIFAESGERVILSVEYMDTKHFSYTHYLESLKQIYKYKYANKRFNVIIVSADEALGFIFQNRTEIFYDIPVVFSGISKYDLGEIKGHKNITGVIESDDALDNIKLALKLHPKTRQVAVLSPGRHNKNIINEIKNNLPENIEFLQWHDIYNSDIDEKLKTLVSDVILLPISAPRTKAGTNIPYEMFVERIAKVSNAPVYTLSDTALGSGAVGGRVVSSYAQGQTAAQLALRIIHGENASKVPIIMNSANRYMFDYIQLQRFAINEADLPQDSIIINKPFSIYEEYHKEINLAIFLILLQAGIICLLIINNKRRKQAEFSLKTVNEELEERITRRTEQISNMNSQLLKKIEERKEIEDTLREINMALANAMPGISRLDKNGCYITLNDIYAEMLGYVPEELKGKNWEQTVISDDHTIAITAYKEMLNVGKGEFEARAIRKDGTKFYKQVMMIKIKDNDGEHAGHYCFMRDITERKKAVEAVKRSREQLRNLATRLQVLRDEEQIRISREIHDVLGQNLTGLKMNLSWLREHLPKNLKQQSARVNEMMSIVDTSLVDTRRVAYRLRPAILDDLGLKAAIENEVMDFSKHTGCRYMINLDGVNLKQKSERDTALFRILQEALTNIARHAKANNIEISLQSTGLKLMLTITDDGVGIKPDTLAGTQSLGLIGMSERASALGGNVKIDTISEGGTRLTVTLPLD